LHVNALEPRVLNVVFGVCHIVRSFKSLKCFPALKE
jgi:hypothetical protein